MFEYIEFGKVEGGIPIREEIDYTKGWIEHSPDYIGEEGSVSNVVDCYK